MNRYRSAPKTPMSVFITLAAAAVVATAGGVMHAVCKNHQVLTERKIDATQKRIEQEKLDIQITEVRMDLLLDRYELKERLKVNGSAMVNLDYGDIVEVRPAGVRDGEVAAVQRP